MPEIQNNTDATQQNDVVTKVGRDGRKWMVVPRTAPAAFKAIVAAGNEELAAFRESRSYDVAMEHKILTATQSIADQARDLFEKNGKPAIRQSERHNEIKKIVKDTFLLLASGKPELADQHFERQYSVILNSGRDSALSSPQDQQEPTTINSASQKRKYHRDGSKPDGDMVWVFGSNSLGDHVGGAAKVAKDHFGAEDKVAIGPTGNSYAIPTLASAGGAQLPFGAVKQRIAAFIQYAQQNPHKKFFVTRIGCSIAGFDDKDIAPLFANAPLNCSMPDKWRSLLEQAQPSVAPPAATPAMATPAKKPVNDLPQIPQRPPMDSRRESKTYTMEEAGDLGEKLEALYTQGKLSEEQAARYLPARTKMVDAYVSMHTDATLRPQFDAIVNDIGPIFEALYKETQTQSTSLTAEQPASTTTPLIPQSPPQSQTAPPKSKREKESTINFDNPINFQHPPVQEILKRYTAVPDGANGTKYCKKGDTTKELFRVSRTGDKIDVQEKPLSQSTIQNMIDLAIAMGGRSGAATLVLKGDPAFLEAMYIEAKSREPEAKLNIIGFDPELAEDRGLLEAKIQARRETLKREQEMGNTRQTVPEDETISATPQTSPSVNPNDNQTSQPVQPPSPLSSEMEAEISRVEERINGILDMASQEDPAIDTHQRVFKDELDRLRNEFQREMAELKKQLATKGDNIDVAKSKLVEVETHYKQGLEDALATMRKSQKFRLQDPMQEAAGAVEAARKTLATHERAKNPDVARLSGVLNELIQNAATFSAFPEVYAMHARRAASGILKRSPVMETFETLTSLNKGHQQTVGAPQYAADFERMAAKLQTDYLKFMAKPPEPHELTEYKERMREEIFQITKQPPSVSTTPPLEIPKIASSEQISKVCSALETEIINAMDSAFERAKDRVKRTGSATSEEEIAEAAVLDTHYAEEYYALEEMQKDVQAFSSLPKSEVDLQKFQSKVTQDIAAKNAKFQADLRPAYFIKKYDELMGKMNDVDPEKIDPALNKKRKEVESQLGKDTISIDYFNNNGTGFSQYVDRLSAEIDDLKTINRLKSHDSHMASALSEGEIVFSRADLKRLNVLMDTQEEACRKGRKTLQGKTFKIERDVHTDQSFSGAVATGDEKSSHCLIESATGKFKLMSRQEAGYAKAGDYAVVNPTLGTKLFTDSTRDTEIQRNPEGNVAATTNGHTRSNGNHKYR